MLPAHIIDSIREREARRREEQRPQPTLELPQVYPVSKPAAEEKSDRGVTVIELL